MFVKDLAINIHTYIILPGNFNCNWFVPPFRNECLNLGFQLRILSKRMAIG